IGFFNAVQVNRFFKSAHSSSLSFSKHPSGVALAGIRLLSGVSAGRVCLSVCAAPSDYSFEE
ncbi:MAG: hypothetical protein V1721_07830, partial [Pseudomonadota bacterium]